MMPTSAAIEVSDLNIRFADLHAVKDFEFSVERGSCFGIVGESGSGKSTVLRVIAGLNENWSGSVVIEGKGQGPVRDRAFYRRVQMVFQDPFGSLHPKKTLDDALAEPLAIHGIGDREARIKRVMDEVSLPASFRFRYPHQLSGGQRQRVAIARALVLDPAIILLDEPTSALDVSVQAEVLNLLATLRSQHGLTFVLVSHDLGVVAHMCDRLLIMQSGIAVEEITAATLRAKTPASNYARELIAASAGFRREATT